MSFFYADIKSKQILNKKTSNNDSAEIKMYDADNSNNVILKAPGVIGTSFSLVLPSSIGTNNQVIKTDGNGVLGWVDNIASGTIDASNITAGDAEVNIGTTSGSVTYNSSSGRDIIIKENDTDIIGFTSGNVILYGSTKLRMRPDDININIESDASGTLSIDGGQVSFIAPVIDFTNCTTTNMRGNGIYSNMTLADDNSVVIDNNTLHVHSATNTTFDFVSSSNKIQVRGDNNAIFSVTSGQPISFDLTKSGSNDVKFIKSSGDTYINMTSTEGSSGVGLRIADGDLQIRNNSSASWSRMTGFPLSITTVTTDSAVSIPAGCGGIIIKANAPGGGGGGTGQNLNSNDPQTYGGGGGGGEYGEIYIYGSNLGSNTIVYVDIGTAGVGKAYNQASPEDGTDASNLVIKLYDTVSNSTVIELEGGKGGAYGHNSGTIPSSYAQGGLGGGGSGEASILSGIGFTVPGSPGEAGYIPGKDLDQLSYGKGGNSFLGAGGRAGTVVTTLPLVTAGINGGGGAGASRDDEATVRTGYDGTNGGGGIVYIYFY